MPDKDGVWVSQAARTHTHTHLRRGGPRRDCLAFFALDWTLVRDGQRQANRQEAMRQSPITRESGLSMPGLQVDPSRRVLGVQTMCSDRFPANIDQNSCKPCALIDFRSESGSLRRPCTCRNPLDKYAFWIRIQKQRRITIMTIFLLIRIQNTYLFIQLFSFEFEYKQPVYPAPSAGHVPAEVRQPRRLGQPAADDLPCRPRGARPRRRLSQCERHARAHVMIQYACRICVCMYELAHLLR